MEQNQEKKMEQNQEKKMDQNQEKKMAENQEFDKYAKVKIEEPNLQLPNDLLRVNTDPSGDKLYYIKILQDDSKRVQHLREAIAAGAQLDRKVYRIRNVELLKATGEDFKVLDIIQKVSKATIGVLGDAESERHFHAFIDLVGAVEEVKRAEELIIDQILKTYTFPMFPVILMPPNIYGHEIKIPEDKVGLLTGNNTTLFGMEIVSGAWLQERTVRIYGPKPQVVKAAQLLHSTLYEPGEYVEGEKEMDMLFSELSFGEKMEGMKSRTLDITDLASKLIVGEQKQQDGEGGSGSGFGSGQTEEQKQQENVAEPEHKGFQDEPKDETHQHDKDVEEATSGETSQQRV